MVTLLSQGVSKSVLLADFLPYPMTTRTRSSIGRALLLAAAVPAALSAQTLTIFDGDEFDNIMLFEGSDTYGSADTDTVYTNFFTEGGAG